MEKLALLGGTPVIKENEAPEELFKWPIITQEDKEAAMNVILNNTFSGTDITAKFQEEFAAWQGTKYAVAYPNGTMALACAMFAIGLGRGDEIICPTKTYWASITSALTFGAVPVFCNISKEDLCLDPDDLERCITPKTKAIMVVHYLAHPCDMDRIMAIAKKHNLLVIEDVSHAQGGMYKGKKLGTFGDVSAMSLMSGKSFAAGELGILVTDNRKYYERSIAYGQYEQNSERNIQQCEDLKPYLHIALGGVKGRANQLCVELARGQLKHYDERCAEIRKAVNYFWDLLEGLPGIRPIRVDESTGSNMAGWYIPHGIYHPEELGGLSVNKFCEAVRAEIDFKCSPGANRCLHTHNLFKTFDFAHAGVPTVTEFTDRDVREENTKCDPSVDINCFSAPWFKQFDKEWIEKFARGYRKVIENYTQLLESDEKTSQGGRWFGTENN